jgi:hypothetical protein
MKFTKVMVFLEILNAQNEHKLSSLTVMAVCMGFSNFLRFRKNTKPGYWRVMVMHGYFKEFFRILKRNLKKQLTKPHPSISTFGDFDWKL